MIDVRAQFSYSKVCCEIHKHVFIINASILSEQKIYKKLKVLSETLKRFHFGYLRLVISCILIDCCLMVTKQIHVISTIPVQYANLTEFTFLIIVQMLNGKILQNLTQLTKFCKMTLSILKEQLLCTSLYLEFLNFCIAWTISCIYTLPSHIFCMRLKPLPVSQ